MRTYSIIEQELKATQEELLNAYVFGEDTTELEKQESALQLEFATICDSMEDTYRHAIEVAIPCIMCGKEHTLILDERDLEDWQKGKHAQDAFPYLDDNEREMLISHICPECWNKMFREEE